MFTLFFIRRPIVACVISILIVIIGAVLFTAFCVAGVARLLAFSSTSVTVKRRSPLAAERRIAERLDVLMAVEQLRG